MGIHISLGILVWGYTKHGDTHITVTPVPGFQCHQQDVAGDVVLPSSETRGKFLPLHLKMIVVAALLLLNFFCQIHVYIRYIQYDLNMPRQISEMNIENRMD
jgi:hypothetical protein